MVCIELSLRIEAPIQRCFDLSRSIEVHLIGAAQSGEAAVGGVTAGLIGLGQCVRWRAKHFGVTQHLTSKITALDYPRYFQDTMVHGAFKFMQHDHYFQAISSAETEMKDRFVFSAPFPLLGLLAERLFLKRYMENFLVKRNRILKDVAESRDWQDFLPEA